MPRQVTIPFHINLFVAQLHHVRCTKINQVSIAGVWKQHIRKATRMFDQLKFKISFPEKIDEVCKCRGWRHPVVTVFEMFSVKKFNVLQRIYK